MSGAAIPKNLDEVLGSFDDRWSPRIVTTVNDYDVRVAHVEGEHLWHAHAETDEFFLVLSGEFSIDLRDGPESGEAEASERRVDLGPNDIFVVPRGIEHRPLSPCGATILMFEPNGTPTVGDFDGEVPAHIDATTGHTLG